MALTNNDPKKQFDISNLMSPPELPPIESFTLAPIASLTKSSTPKRTHQTTSDMRGLPRPNQPLSPPISPATRIDDGAVSNIAAVNSPVQDPILYPSQQDGHISTQQPLFSRDDRLDTQRIINDHVVARPASLFRQSAPPENEDYELMLAFKSQVIKKYLENPKGWLRRERAQLLADRDLSRRYNHPFKTQRILPAKPQPIRTHTQRIVKPSAAPKSKQSQASAPRPIRSNLVANPCANPVANPVTPKQNAVRRVSGTPDPTRRTVAPNREDKDFAALEDLCPPLSSLPSKPNSLKVDWKGAPLDLSNDPNRHLLHPDELTLAGNLRLDCATYLTSKRRIFIKRRDCLRIDKEFRKTDAQQACKIDVNKASKLWTAYDKVGWLGKEYVAQHI